MKDLNFCIDIGNTNAKAGFFVNNEMVKKIDAISLRSLTKLVKKEAPSNIIISSVRKGIRKFVHSMEKSANTILLTHETPVPFTNKYASPETLGRDRIAAMAGAEYLYGGKNCLVIDIGTCITYDLLHANLDYFGGSISPGIDMRFKALHKFTSKLPLVSFNKKHDLIGTSTSGAMISGVVNGTIAEIEGIISGYTQFFEEITIIICGGGTKFFESQIKGHIFAVPDLILIGLNRILSYNLNEEKVLF